MTCKQTCKWGTPAMIHDGPAMFPIQAIRTKLKSAKGAEKTRLEDLLTNQARLCFSCGKRAPLETV